MENFEHYMKIALNLAKERKGFTHPNPTVGAVIVKDNQIIGKGYHYKAGYLHAEREAIKDAKEKGYDLKDSTIFVTLEPCCHYGKTPPCTNAIIEEGISKVVIGCLDENPLVRGKGVEILKSHGIEVITGVLEKECKKINEDFFIYISKKRPFIHIKVAQTLDGKIATKIGDSKWITNEKSRQFAHILRNEATAILVGTNTVLKDNPVLTVRNISTEKQPTRVVIDRDLKIPINYNVFNSDAKTIVITSENVGQQRLNIFEEKENIEIVKLSTVKNRFKVEDILKVLYEKNIVHLLVEGGKDTISEFLKMKIVDKISLFIAPKIIGEDGLSSIGSLDIENVKDSLKLKIEDFKIFDGDFYFECYLQE